MLTFWMCGIINLKNAFIKEFSLYGLLAPVQMTINLKYITAASIGSFCYEEKIYMKLKL